MLTLEGNLVGTDKIFRGRVEIDDLGIITAVKEPQGTADLTFTDELIFPGFVDLHVHARECIDHSQDYKEDFFSASEASINGGVVAFCDMPNNPAPPVDEASYMTKKELTKRALVNILLYAGIGKNTTALPMKVPYKVYMGQSVGDLFFESNEDLEDTISKYQGQNVSFHCEDPKELEINKHNLSHEEKRPPVAESLAVEFALYLIEKYNLNGKICHCSTLQAVETVILAKKRGVKVTMEITPHHLFFNQPFQSEDQHKFLQVNPPIRKNQKERLQLIEYLQKGEIDFLATDHAPHTLEEKMKGTSGMPHLDTYGSFVSWLMHEHKFSPQEICRVCSANPGNFFNQFSHTKYGRIAEGFSGSLSVLDMNKPNIITRENLKTKCGWSPFEDVKFPGTVTHTIVNGKVYKQN